MNAVPIRGSLVGQVIDGRFSLLEWLGGSDTTGTFITELSSSQKAAIKLFSAPAQAEERLFTWTKTDSLSHDNLVRILHFGRGEIEGAPIVYVVTELAEEVLSQIIPERPLAAEEAREMLVTILDALSYLHSKNYVHARLKPSNILVVENEVKLSAEGILARNSMPLGLESNDLHNAPEMGTSPAAPAADIWSLGVTLVEALTQQLPVWDSAGNGDPVIPELPKPFSMIAQQCLRVDPSSRCTLSDIRLLLEGKSKPTSAPIQDLPEPPVVPKETEKTPSAHLPLVPLVIGFLLLVAIIVGLAIHSHKTETASFQTEGTRQSPPAEPDAQPAAPSASATANAKGEVLHRVVPDVPQSASNTIHGRVGVSIRVTVDTSGSVANAEFVSRGPSDYFARLAIGAARDWKFKPAQQNGHAIESSWLLRFEFRRTGADVTQVESTP